MIHRLPLDTVLFDSAVHDFATVDRQTTRCPDAFENAPTPIRIRMPVTFTRAQFAPLHGDRTQHLRTRPQPIGSQNSRALIVSSFILDNEALPCRRGFEGDAAFTKDVAMADRKFALFCKKECLRIQAVLVSENEGAAVSLEHHLRVKKVALPNFDGGADQR
ncbi:MAG: hypothetical protein AVDCRST_MAG86-1358 [uncultured Truepera sp.]|uniref:Uncharacterized protein n=1 Tax=uncultured Truepera sp. TaxID=543023 RepID=A0A6J4V7V0_9DEIN|nr:MAG: hypothetical protein AVDCRST_MAG86-1358 [uncultured Truepera sp.]